MKKVMNVECPHGRVAVRVQEKDELLLSWSSYSDATTWGDAYASASVVLSRSKAEELRDALIEAYPPGPEPSEDMPAPWEEE